MITRTGRRHKAARVTIAAVGWSVVAVLLLALLGGLPQAAENADNSDPIKILVRNQGIELGPGQTKSVELNCTGSGYDEQVTTLFIHLDASGATTWSGKTVVVVTWKDSANRTAARETVNTTVEIKDGTMLRQDGLYCSKTYPRYWTFEATLTFSDGGNAVASSTVEVKKA